MNYVYERPTHSDGRIASLSSKNADDVKLSKKIEQVLPGRKFILRANGTELSAIFEEELSAEDKNTLDTEVAAFSPQDPE